MGRQRIGGRRPVGPRRRAERARKMLGVRRQRHARRAAGWQPALVNAQRRRRPAQGNRRAVIVERDLLAKIKGRRLMVAIGVRNRRRQRHQVGYAVQADPLVAVRNRAAGPRVGRVLVNRTELRQRHIAIRRRPGAGRH